MKKRTRRIRPGEFEIRIRKDGKAYFLAADDAMMRVIEGVNRPDTPRPGDTNNRSAKSDG